MDTIDLLQFHVWDDSWAENQEWLRTVERLKREKLIGYFGLSLNRWEPENGIKAIRTGLIDAVQVIYSIFDQSPEDELFSAGQELNIGVIVRIAVRRSNPHAVARVCSAFTVHARALRGESLGGLVPRRIAEATGT